MSLMSAMYDGISGLTVNSQAMSVVGNNLANSSTTGFKESTVQFQDLVYQNVVTGNTFGQVGLGTDLSSISSDFSQGAFEQTNSATDLAISGQGLFMVDNPTTGSTYYTRDGNFTFNSSGYLVDSNGYRVQGWQAYTDSTTGSVTNIGSLGDLQVKSYQLAPSATTKLRMVTNLDSDSSVTQKTTDASNPFFSLFESWDGESSTPLSDTSYSYQSTVKVYDKAGGSHDLTIYYDKASNAAGQNVWQFVVAGSPSEDGRTINGTTVSATSSAGIYMTGTLTFDSSGTVTSMSAFTLSSNATGDLKSLSNWVPATFSSDGYPELTANFSASSNASTATGSASTNIKLDLGIHSTTTNGGWTSPVTDASQVGTSFSSVPTMNSATTDATTTTSYDSSFSIMDQSQDGYAVGYLQSVKVTSGGVVEGVYSNNQTKNLFVVGLATFNNLDGLQRDGNNLFSKTTESGEPRIGTAGSSGFGTIASGELENSNVDTATEMVSMINYQRGFEANSKVVSTIDQLLSEVIQLKR